MGSTKSEREKKVNNSSFRFLLLFIYLIVCCCFFCFIYLSDQLLFALSLLINFHTCFPQVFNYLQNKPFGLLLRIINFKNNMKCMFPVELTCSSVEVS